MSSTNEGVRGQELEATHRADLAVIVNVGRAADVAGLFENDMTRDPNSGRVADIDIRRDDQGNLVPTAQLGKVMEMGQAGVAPTVVLVGQAGKEGDTNKIETLEQLIREGAVGVEVLQAVVEDSGNFKKGRGYLQAIVEMAKSGRVGAERPLIVWADAAKPDSDDIEGYIDSMVGPLSGLGEENSGVVVSPVSYSEEDPETRRKMNPLQRVFIRDILSRLGAQFGPAFALKMTPEQAEKFKDGSYEQEFAGKPETEDDVLLINEMGRRGRGNRVATSKQSQIGKIRAYIGKTMSRIKGEDPDRHRKAIEESDFTISTKQ